jgi:hypothetical protein
MTWSHVTKVEKMKTRLGLMDRIASVKGKLGCEVLDRVVECLSKDLTPMDKCNGEEQVRSRLMNQYGHVKMSSGSYNLMIKTGACVASTMKEIE